VDIVELLPCGQFLVEINVIGVGQQLVEFLLVGPVRSLDLPVQLRGPGLDVHMPDALVLDVPVKLGLVLRENPIPQEETDLAPAGIALDAPPGQGTDPV
jgi:hypothetical protein